MKQEEKELLLKDLSARIPYGVKCNVSGVQQSITLTAIDVFSDYPYKFGVVQFSCTTNVKPYLRPMSSMTDEEKRDLGSILQRIEISSYDFISPLEVKLDWLLKHHFDFRSLISKGLALEAPSDMYKIK